MRKSLFLRALRNSTAAKEMLEGRGSSVTSSVDASRTPSYRLTRGHNSEGSAAKLVLLQPNTGASGTTTGFMALEEHASPLSIGPDNPPELPSREE